MEGRAKAPKCSDTTELPGGGKLGIFWKECKSRRRCGRPPYDRLLTNPALRADYRIHCPGTREQQVNLNESFCILVPKFRSYEHNRPL